MAPWPRGRPVAQRLAIEPFSDCAPPQADFGPRGGRRLGWMAPRAGTNAGTSRPWRSKTAMCEAKSSEGAVREGQRLRVRLPEGDGQAFRRGARSEEHTSE